MERISFRAVEHSDLQMICQMPQNADELFNMYPKAVFPLDEIQLLKAIEARKCSTVIEWDHAVAGFANFYKWDRGGECAIGNVIIDPGFRGKGLGKRLVQKMILLAKEEFSAKAVLISCFNNNTSALNLYAKMGFVPYQIERREKFDRSIALLIQMKLCC